VEINQDMKFSVQKSCQQFVAMICFWSSGKHHVIICYLIVLPLH